VRATELLKMKNGGGREHQGSPKITWKKVVDRVSVEHTVFTVNHGLTIIFTVPQMLVVSDRFSSTGS